MRVSVTVSITDTVLEPHRAILWPLELFIVPPWLRRPRTRSEPPSEPTRYSLSSVARSARNSLLIEPMSRARITPSRSIKIAPVLIMS